MAYYSLPTSLGLMVVRGDRLVCTVTTLPGVEIKHVPHINQGLLRFLDLKPGATEQDHDRRTEEVTARIVASGEAMFACTSWRGLRCMRVSVCGWQTNEEAVARTIRAIEAAL